MTTNVDLVRALGALLTFAAAISCEPAPSKDRPTPPAPPRSAILEPILLSEDRIGPILVGADTASFSRTAIWVRDTVEEGQEGIPERVAILALAGDTIRALHEESTVNELRVTSSRFRTADSLGVGTLVGRLLRVPGVHAHTGEGAVHVNLPHHCGMSFSLAPVGELGDAPGDVGVAELKRLPPSTHVDEVAVYGCGTGIAAPPT